MTINDLPLTEYTRLIHRHTAELDRHIRESMESSLFLDLMLIHEAAGKAIERLEKLKPKPPLPEGYK